MPKDNNPEGCFDAEVTDTFFEPLTDVLCGRPRCKRFQDVWKKHALMYPETTCDTHFVQKIIEIIAPCSKQEAEHASRVASSIIIWFGSNNGYAFMEGLLKGLQGSRKGENYHNTIFTLSVWAVENSLYKKTFGRGRRRLQLILNDGEQIIPLTNLEIDTAERLMMYLSTEQGTSLLEKLVATSNQHFTEERQALKTNPL